MPQKPLLQHVTLNSRGRPASTSTTITELDGSPLGEPIYDTDGNVISSPVSSSAEGLLQVFTRTSRSVLVTPDGATEGIISGFVADPGTGPIHATDLAPVGVDLTLGLTSASAYLNAGMTLAAALGRPFHVNAGMYLITTTLRPPSNSCMYGDGANTILMHADNSANPVLQVTPATDCIIENFCIDGNYANNHDAATGFTSPEAFLGGTNCIYRNLEVSNFNGHGFEISGTHCHYENIRAIGPNVALADYAALAGGSHDMGGMYGMFVAGSSVSIGNTWIDCYAWGTRSAGFYVGGVDCVAVAPMVENCHRKDFPDGVGGGQMALSTAANGTLGLKLLAPRVGAAGSGTLITSGLEIGGGSFIDVIAPTVLGQPNNGITVTTADHVTIVGGISGNNTGGGLVVTDATDLTVSGTHFQTNTYGIFLVGAPARCRFRDVGLHANATANLGYGTPPLYPSYTGTDNTGDGWRVNSGVTPDLPNSLGVPTTTGSGTAALPIARTTQTAVASASLTLPLANDATANLTGMTITLSPGEWEVTGIYFLSCIGAGDLSQTLCGTIAVTSGSATITDPASLAVFSAASQPSAATAAQAWKVVVPSSATIQGRAFKSGGGGTSQCGQTHSKLVAKYMGNP